MSTEAGILLPDRVFEFCREPQAFLLRMARTEGPVAEFRINDENFAILGEPEALHAVFNGPQDDYEKGELYELIEVAFGRSVFTLDGLDWTTLHNVLTPLFSRARIHGLLPYIQTVVERHLEQWQKLADAGQPIEILTAAKRLAFDAVAGGLLGIPNDESADRLFRLLHSTDRLEAVRLRYLGKRVPSVSGHFRQNPVYEEIDRVSFAIAEARIGAATQNDDLIGAAIATPYFEGLEPAEQIRFIRDLVASMLSAGYVTTGETIFWSLCLLAGHPEAQERAREEAERGGATPWISAVISETLRLYPPAWFLGRIARRDVVVTGRRFAAGTRLVCSPYVLHRMSALWTEPDEFRPERFLPGNRHVPRAYVPFGSGMRACIGRALALMEISTLLPAALRRFRFEPVSDAPVVLAGTFSMQPRTLVHLRLESR